MTAVSKTTLSSVPHSATLTILKNTSYIQDPRRASGTRNRKFIYSSDPDATSYDFSAYPYIFLKPVTRVPTRFGADQTTQEITWSQNITLRTIKDGSGMNHEDVGVTDMLSMMDDVQYYFNSLAVRKDYKDVKLNFRAISTLSENEEIVLDGKVILETVFNIIFRSRMVIR